jgi:hypothetical protein
MTEITLVPASVSIAQDWLFTDVEVVHHGKVEDLKAAIELRIGDRPFARSMRKMFEHAGKQLPPEVAALKGDTYLITHAIGVVASSNAGSIDTIGYEASFAEPGSTLELFPTTRFKEYLKADLGFEAGISADGYAKLPNQLGELSKAVLNVGAGAEVQFGTDASVLGKLTFAVKSPKIQAVGTASSKVSWEFDKDENPLVGDQVMIQTVVVPKGQESLTFNMQAFAMLDPGMFRRPFRVETDVITVTVEL